MAAKPRFDGEWVRLGDLGNTQAGGTPSSKHPEFFTGTIPWIGTTALNGGLLDESNAVKMITEEAVAKSATKIVPAGSIMVGIRVGVGKVAINAVPMCTSQDIVSITGIDTDQWNKEYISLALQYKAPILASQAQGATITGITSKTLKSITIPVLALSSQNVVVSQLRGIDRQIACAKKRLEFLGILVKSRFAEMFGDAGWPVATVGSLAVDVRYGTSKKASDCGEYVYLRMNNMTDDGRLDLDDVKRIDLNGPELEKCRVVDGDLLFNRTNSREKVGKTVVFHEREPMVIAGYIIRVRLGDRVRPDFLATYMNLPTTKAMLRSIAKGAVHQANINSRELSAIEVPVPPMELQDRFLSFAAEVDKSRFIVQQQIEKLQLLYDSLAQEYFS